MNAVLRASDLREIAHFKPFFVKNSCHLVPLCGFVVKGVIGPVIGK